MMMLAALLTPQGNTEQYMELSELQDLNGTFDEVCQALSATDSKDEEFQP